MVNTLAIIQQAVREHVEQPPDIAGALRGRAIVSPLHLEIGLSTATIVDDPVIGFGSEGSATHRDDSP